MKREPEIKEELQRANAGLIEIEDEMRKCGRDKSECMRRWIDLHGYIEALWWVLGNHKGLAES